MDVSEYLALRSSNDLLRQTGIDWLITMFATVAGEVNREGAAIQISRNDAHRFKVGHATMVGSLLTLTNGERVLSVEAGWPRAPQDGFIRGGGLARANIKHRGLKSASEELRLVVAPAGTPRWMVQRKHGGHSEFLEASIRDHLSILVDESQTPSRSHHFR
jgi:hypothetical protein